MNSSQIHLALTHVPVLLSVVGVVLLAIALIRKNDTLIKTSFYMLLFAGISALPVYLTGEGAEEIVEHLPGVSEPVIEEHEELAGVAFGLALATGVFALTGLVVYNREKILRVVRPSVLVLGLATGVVMVITAHLGGQVRHTEIRPDFTPPHGEQRHDAIQGRE